MSRTDKTDPWHVKSRDPNLHYRYFDNAAQKWTTWPKWWVGAARCNCYMCYDADDLRRRHRKERQEGKRQARNWERDY